MYRKILVPLDGSQLAEGALPYAEELAARLGSEIFLLAVANSAEAEDYHKRQLYISKVVEDTRKNIELLAGKSKVKKIQVEAGILVGQPAEQIADYAEKEHVSLIVMATHGQTGIKRWAMGGVAGKVIKEARKPVALIRSNTSVSALREKGILHKVLVLLDGSKESEAVIPCIEQLTVGIHADITLLQVVGKPYRLYADAQGYLERVASALENEGVIVASEVRVGSAADEVIKFAEETGTDMVAMTVKEKPGIGRWAIGSVAERVLHFGNTPVLLVRAPGASTYRIV